MQLVFGSSSNWRGWHRGSWCFCLLWIILFCRCLGPGITLGGKTSETKGSALRVVRGLLAVWFLRVCPVANICLALLPHRTLQGCFQAVHRLGCCVPGRTYSRHRA